MGIFLHKDWHIHNYFFFITLAEVSLVQLKIESPNTLQKRHLRCTHFEVETSKCCLSQSRTTKRGGNFWSFNNLLYMFWPGWSLSWHSSVVWVRWWRGWYSVILTWLKSIVVFISCMRPVMERLIFCYTDLIEVYSSIHQLYETGDGEVDILFY